jgi:hypothetical protein
VEELIDSKWSPSFMTYSIGDHSGGKKRLRFKISKVQRPEGDLDH